MATSETGALMKDGAFKVDSPFQPAGDQPKAIDGWWTVSTPAWHTRRCWV
ncbi:hypothetical protein AU15_06360 [Marinobacter salarius]|uniref:Uncharacterized protein n=1 Tax=Marinobacter salarius TaxID=1420917 RepID=W5YUZ6_9GAMM|nr:hypothetical protein AU15_06360 [Marinobacter salarius]